MSLVLATILQFLPFVIILWFANIAEGRKEAGKPYQGWTVLTYVLLGILLLYRNLWRLAHPSDRRPITERLAARTECSPARPDARSNCEVFHAWALDCGSPRFWASCCSFRPSGVSWRVLIPIEPIERRSHSRPGLYDVRPVPIACHHWPWTGKCGLSGREHRRTGRTGS